MAADPATTALVITAAGSAISGAILAIAKLIEALAVFRDGPDDDDDELHRRRRKHHHHRRPVDDDDPDDDESGILLRARLAL